MNRRTAVWCAAATVAALAMAWPGAAWAGIHRVPAVAAQPSATASPASPLQATPTLSVSITSVAPAIPQPGDHLVVSGTLTNLSRVAVSNLTDLLLYDPQRFDTRSSLDAFASGSGTFGFAGGPTEPLARQSLAPGASEPFRVVEPLDNLGLTQIGSYALGVQAQGYTSQGSQVTAAARTFLPWWPLDSAGAPAPTPVGWLWPLADRPHRGVGAQFLDNDLAGELQPGGRLAGLVAEGAAAQNLPTVAGRPRTTSHGRTRPAVLPTTPVPLTWVVDPLLADEVRAMAAGYSVRGHSIHDHGAAAAWLAAASAAVARGSLIGLGYADPDLVALNRSGLTRQIQLAGRLGATDLGAALGTSPLPGYALPPGGLIDQSTLDTLGADGYRNFVLNDVSLPPFSLVFTHSALSRVPLSDHTKVTAFVSDSTLDSVVAAGAGGGPAGASSAVQRFLAESLFIDYEYPQLTRALVIVPPTLWRPSADYANSLLTATARAPWLTPMTLPEIAADPTVNVANRAALYYPGSARSGELPARYLAATTGIQRRIDILAALTGKPAQDRLVRGLQNGLLASLSTSWRSDQAQGESIRRATANEVNGYLGSVQVSSAGLVTLTSHHGTVPITIVNRLPDPVTVSLRLQAPEARIAPLPGPIAVRANEALQEEIAVTLQAAGVFPLQVQLTTADGQPLGAPVLLRIRSTAYGGVAVGITAGAFALLLIGAGFRVARRVRAATAARPTDSSQGTG